MSLQVLAVAALLVGSAAVLTVVATTPAPPALPGAGTPAGAHSLGAAAPAPGSGRLDLLVRNTGEELTVRVTVSADADAARPVFRRDVTLPARADWTHTLRVPAEAYTARMDVHPGAQATGGGDLRHCVDLHGLWEAHVQAGPLRTASEFGARSIDCVAGRAPDAPPAEEAAEGPHRMTGTGNTGVAVTGLPQPGCLPPACTSGASFGSGTVGFELTGPAKVTVRATWDPATPASERLRVALYRDLGGGSGEGVGMGEGAREIVFDAEAPEGGPYWLSAQPSGPVGAAARQDVNYEVTWTYG